MKTIKNFWFVLLMLASWSFNSSAQCPLSLQVQYGPLGQRDFSFIADSGNLVINSYDWDFGDGTTSQSQYPSHTYTASGTYIVCLTYLGACSGMLCDTLIINVCDFNPQTVYTLNGRDASFSILNAYPGASYEWGFHSLNSTPFTFFSTDSNPRFTFPAFGRYWSETKVTLPNGCIDSSFNWWVMVPNPCEASFFWRKLSSTEAEFHASPYDSINPAHYSYHWNFGDGSTSTDATPTHDFGGYGSWNVCLVVSATGCIDTLCKTINMVQPPPPSYSIYGNISKGGDNACFSRIYLISDSGGYLNHLRTYYTQDSAGVHCFGNYAFLNMPEGRYYVKAMLDSADADYANYLPTYYGDVLNWSDATAIDLTSTKFNVDIHLVAGNNPGGPGFIGGWVSQGAGLKAGPDFSGANRDVGDPLSGVQINLLTDGDIPVVATYTDGAGHYSFGNLALGTYKVYAEEINKVPYSMNVTLTSNNPSQENINVSINSNSAVTGIDDLLEMKIEGMFPNPMSDVATISVSARQNSKATCTLTDVNGRLLQTQNLEISEGVNQIKLDLRTQSNGIYLFSLTNNASKKVMRIVKAQ